MARLGFAWLMLAAALVASALAWIWRDNQERQILIVLILSILAAIVEGVNAVQIAHDARKKDSEP